MKTRLPEINWMHVAVEMAGGAPKVATQIGVNPAAVYKWIHHGKMGHVPAETVRKLSKMSGVAIEKLI